MRKTRLAVSTVLAAMTASFTVMAGAWKSDANGWWYDEGNGSYPKNTWSWIDGNNDGVSECYYFNPNGYCLINTTTPDNYYVDQSGAWVVNGVVQTKSTGTAVSKSSDSVEVVTGKITIGEKKNKNKNNNKSSKSSSYDDEYDYEDDDTEEEEETSNSKKSSNKSGKNKFADGLDMFDLPWDSSERVKEIITKLELRGMDWNGAKEFAPDSDGSGNMESYTDYYIGGNYKTLRIKATPKTIGDRYYFKTDTIVDVIVSNGETGDVLFSQRVDADTKLINIKADVTDVDYVRITCEKKNDDADCCDAYILMKDAILTK